MNDLKDKFKQFAISKDISVKKPFNIRSVFGSINTLLIENKKAIAISSDVLEALSSFKQHKTYYSLFSKSMSLVLDNFAGGEYASDLFNIQNGWILNENTSFFNLFLDEIKTIQSKTMYFKFDTGVETRMFSINGMQFCYSIDIHAQSIMSILNRSSDEGQWSLLIDHLIGLKLKDKDNKIFSIEPYKKSNETRMKLYAQDFNYFDSETSKIISDKIQKYLDKGISRSIILNGTPGTGKSTLSKAIVKNLDLKVLKIKKSELLSADNILSLIEFLGIECVILDDFDYGKNLNENLDLLENLKSKVKVVIGIINNLKELSPALVRPGRFDEIITVENLSESVVKNLLKDNMQYFDRVKNWPISFINEFVCRSKVLDKQELEDSLEELDQREKNNRGCDDEEE